jgi:hypothetical protein
MIARMRLTAGAVIVLLAAACQGGAGAKGDPGSYGPLDATQVSVDTNATNLPPSGNRAQSALQILDGRNRLLLPQYCGTYQNGSNGANVGGYLQAVAHCKTVGACGVPAGVRPCTADDVMHLEALGKPVPDTGWVFAGMACDAMTDGGTTKRGVFWNATAHSLSESDCNALSPSSVLLCCR